MSAYFVSVPQVFVGNTDNDSTKTNLFDPSIVAQYIRIIPVVCRKACTLRMELVGCELNGKQIKGASWAFRKWRNAREVTQHYCLTARRLCVRSLSCAELVCSPHTLCVGFLWSMQVRLMRGGSGQTLHRAITFYCTIIKRQITVWMEMITHYQFPAEILKGKWRNCLVCLFSM